MPRHTVYEAVAEGPRIHRFLGDEREIVTAALEAAELRPAGRFPSRLPHELSGGQRQRVVIAGRSGYGRACSSPTNRWRHWTRPCAGEILGLLLRLRRQLGLAGLVITHDLGLAWHIADRVAVLYRGRLVEVGTVEEVLPTPRHEYTKALLAALPGGVRAQIQS